jgi:hypothetical protein
MPGFITVKFTPKSGAPQFEVKNVTDYSWSVSRQPAPNHHLGHRNHEIGNLSITRHKSFEENGVTDIEAGTLKLAAGTEQKAYFSGEITLAPASNSTTFVQTLRFDQGHIIHVDNRVGDNGISETLEICVTNLKVDDETFQLGPTA